MPQEQDDPIDIDPFFRTCLQYETDPTSQCRLGSLYMAFYQAFGNPEDLRHALYFYSKAVAQSSAPAQYALGYLYAKGLGALQPDADKAFYYFQLSAQQGYAKALYSCGVMYECGITVSKDLEHAQDYYQQAAQQEHPRANEALARIELYLETEAQRQATQTIDDAIKEKLECFLEEIQEMKDELKQFKKTARKTFKALQPITPGYEGERRKRGRPPKNRLASEHAYQIHRRIHSVI